MECILIKVGLYIESYNVYRSNHVHRSMTVPDGKMQYVHIVCHIYIFIPSCASIKRIFARMNY